MTHSLPFTTRCKNYVTKLVDEHDVGAPGDRLKLGGNATGGWELDIRVDRPGVVLMPELGCG